MQKQPLSPLAKVSEKSSPPALALGAQRFLSLDVFRGITVCLMIIVNSAGKGAPSYPQLIHAKWFGFTLADLVFPSFLFAVGNAMSFSTKKSEQIQQGTMIIKIIKRTLLIFLIGYLLYWFPFVEQLPDGSWGIKAIEETRIMGVLQRIALCYCISMLLTRYISSEKLLVALSILILLTYWAILYTFGDAGMELTMEGNAIRKLDLTILGYSHIYKRDSIPFDPEGILSTIPAVVNVLAGYLAGMFIQRQGKTFECISRLLMTGTILVLLALCFSPFFPIAKKLWTSPFVLLTTGIDLCVLALLIYSIEIAGWKKGISFFNTLGKNPLFLYLLSELLYIVLNLINIPTGQSIWEWISITIFQQILPGSAGSLATAITFMLLCWTTGWWLDRRKIYIKI